MADDAKTEAFREWLEQESTPTVPKAFLAAWELRGAHERKKHARLVTAVRPFVRRANPAMAVKGALFVPALPWQEQRLADAYEDAVAGIGQSEPEDACDKRGTMQDESLAAAVAKIGGDDENG
ncbi:MAG: hypothetical protein V3V08_07450 [Nannocystaceae bacterium]